MFMGRGVLVNVHPDFAVFLQPSEHTRKEAKWPVIEQRISTDSSIQMERWGSATNRRTTLQRSLWNPKKQKPEQEATCQVDSSQNRRDKWIL